MKFSRFLISTGGLVSQGERDRRREGRGEGALYELEGRSRREECRLSTGDGESLRVLDSTDGDRQNVPTFSLDERGSALPDLVLSVSLYNRSGGGDRRDSLIWRGRELRLSEGDLRRERRLSRGDGVRRRLFEGM